MHGYGPLHPFSGSDYRLRSQLCAGRDADNRGRRPGAAVFPLFRRSVMTTNNDPENRAHSRAMKIEVVFLVAAICATAIWATLLFGNVGSEANAAYDPSAGVSSISRS